MQWTGCYKSFLFSVHQWFFFLLVIFAFSSCNTTKYVPENQYLLGKNTLNFDKNAFKREELKNYIKQKPNKRILGVKFHLALYNLSDLDNSNWFHRWLRKIGEEPVVTDPYLVDKSTQQLTTYAHNKGYFNATVTKFIVYRKKKSKVSYTLQSGKPYTIRKIDYVIEDTSLNNIILGDSLNTIFKRGDLYDSEKLQQERERIERYLKNRGYFNFTKEYVFYEVDSTVGRNQVDLFIDIKQVTEQAGSGMVKVMSHRKYNIGNVFVYMDFDARKALADQADYFSHLDTVRYDGLFFIGENLNFSVRPEVVKRANYIIPGNRYNLENVDKTYNHLASLRIFKLVNILFREAGAADQPVNEEGTLDCHIQLSTFKKQSYAVEVEGTNSAGYLGVAGNFIYQHKNLFKGAEFFDTKFRGATEAYVDTTADIRKIRNSREIGIETGLQLPRFLFPFLNTESFVKKYDPKTRFSLAYNYQDRRDYTRTIARASFGYQWKGNAFTTFFVTPFDFNTVRIWNIDSVFKKKIEDTYLEYSFRDVLISESSLSFIYNNQNIKKKVDFTLFRFNAASAGNVFSAYNMLTNKPKTEGTYNILGNEYAQYIKTDADFSYHQVVNDASEFVYRVFIGAGIPYGNSQALPFEKRYFSGGANSLRAWTVRGVGPGSSTQKVSTRFPNQTGDIKLEANLEYRFELFWVLEGALFIDMGNVWDMRYESLTPNSNFDWSRFYKELALGTGLGIRFDFSFFLIRLDMGLKLYDPNFNPLSDQNGSVSTLTTRWPLFNPNLSRDYRLMAIQIGLGYPF